MATRITAKNFLGSASIFVLIICNALYVKAFECGTTDYTTSLITKGLVTERGEWPFLTALFLAQEFKFFCAGSIISAQHVLTAAHCIQEKGNFIGLQAVNVVVRLGAYNLKLGNESDVVQRNVSDIYVHPDWDVFDEKYDADLAILLLNEVVYFTDYIRPVCMPADNSTIDNVEGSVVGWGLTEIGTSLNLESIKHATTTTLNDSYCYTQDDVMAAWSTRRTFCGRGLNGNPNSGDSGGGFYILHGSAWVQYGILSAMRSNASGFVDANTISIYTNVMEFKDWISETVNKSGETVGVADIFVKIVLRCDYGFMDQKYGCRVNDLNIRGDNHTVTSFTGSHKFLQSNEDVEIISFNNGTMFSLPFGIGKLFKNLKILEVNRFLKTRRIRRSNFNNMINLVNLRIQSSDIETLEYDCFRNLSNLEVFALSFSTIQQIDERTFETNTKLKELNIYGNKLTILPEKLFQNNFLLEIVNIVERRLAMIGEKIFETNTKLRNVVIEANLTVLPEYLFRNNLLLEKVHLAGDSLPTIDETTDEIIFDSSTELEEISLSRPLTVLPTDLFRNNLLLESVSLLSMSLTTIGERIFENHTKLRAVDLSENLLTMLPGNLFQNNSLLESASIGKNHLNSIDEKTFETNTELRRVRLHSNKLKNLPKNLFKNNLLLEYVNLQHNSFKTIDEMIFHSNVNLNTVALPDNQLEVLPKNLFQNNLLLEYVEVWDNYLKIIEVDFAPLTKLKEIGLTNNVCIDAYYHASDVVDPKQISNLTEFQNLIRTNCSYEIISLKS